MEAAPGCGPGTCNGCASSNLVLHPNVGTAPEESVLRRDLSKRKA